MPPAREHAAAIAAFNSALELTGDAAWEALLRDTGFDAKSLRDFLASEANVPDYDLDRWRDHFAAGTTGRGRVKKIANLMVSYHQYLRRQTGRDPPRGDAPTCLYCSGTAPSPCAICANAHAHVHCTLSHCPPLAEEESARCFGQQFGPGKAVCESCFSNHLDQLSQPQLEALHAKFSKRRRNAGWTPEQLLQSVRSLVVPKTWAVSRALASDNSCSSQ